MGHYGLYLLTGLSTAFYQLPREEARGDRDFRDEVVKLNCPGSLQAYLTGLDDEKYLEFLVWK